MSVCPCCGYCPSCGRRAYPYQYQYQWGGGIGYNSAGISGLSQSPQSGGTQWQQDLSEIQQAFREQKAKATNQ